MNKSRLLSCVFTLFFVVLSTPEIFGQSALVIETHSLEISLSQQGKFKSLVDIGHGRDYLERDTSSHLLAIRADGRYFVPDEAVYDTLSKTITFLFNSVGVMMEVVYQNKGDYVTFTLANIIPSERIELILWGPVSTTINKTIGETVGVVRDGTFALGIQCLNSKTLGGFPSFEDDSEPVFEGYSRSNYTEIPDTLRRTFRGQTARATGNGSLLQAYCRERLAERTVPLWGYDKVTVPGFLDGGVQGSAIAIFGCPEDSVLNTIEKIELGENLPHPVIDGRWFKKSPLATASCLMLDFSEATIDKAIGLAEKAGLSYLYHPDPFESWGHFGLKDSLFPNGIDGLKKCVYKAYQKNIRLGVHVLSNFITTNDAYVTPIPDERLAKAGAAILGTDLDEKDTVLEIDDPVYFGNSSNSTLHAAVMDQEVITYRETTKEKPWKLLGCVRGAFNTTPGVHMMGAPVQKLMDHPYKTFLTDISLSEEVASKLAQLFNQTGLMQISFDGLEGLYSTGMGQYARNRFVEKWYNELKPDLKGRVINDASMAGHYHWHMFTRMNWGEPWRNGFRESQIQYRLLNQDYFRRNYIPPMLGWFKLDAQASTEDIEWLLARAAGFGAGFAIVTSFETVEKNGQINDILSKINSWENLRLKDAFPPEIKKRMRDIHNEFTLRKNADKSYSIYEYYIARKEFAVTPDEKSGSAVINMNNPYDEQAMQFLVYNSDNTQLTNLSLDINGSVVKLGADLKKGEIIKYSGGGQVLVFSKDGWLQREVSVNPLSMKIRTGENKVILRYTSPGSAGGKVKSEFKTMSPPEKIQPPPD